MSSLLLLLSLALGKTVDSWDDNFTNNLGLLRNRSSLLTEVLIFLKDGFAHFVDFTSLDFLLNGEFLDLSWLTIDSETLKREFGNFLIFWMSRKLKHTHLQRRGRRLSTRAPKKFHLAKFPFRKPHLAKIAFGTTLKTKSKKYA